MSAADDHQVAAVKLAQAVEVYWDELIGGGLRGGHLGDSHDRAVPRSLP